MRNHFSFSFLFLLITFSSAAQVRLKPGLKISRSVKFQKAVYRFAAPADRSKGVVHIEGDDIVVDFAGAELQGDGPGKKPDAYAGLAIVVRNSRRVTIRNLKARGYKIALEARNCEKLVIENCDFSYNYRQHLNSTPEKEDISDWMSYHHNEKDEWMRYGAAIYLRDCDSVNIERCVVTGGQNALMMTGCDDGRIVNNDFSFNSGIGIGMYRCNRNGVSFNRLIFNVRGYSHGVYNRGQDSAGILVYEQSNDNSFYYNNVTHGGDGFFLWAGQYTMDTGKGGCNNNILYGNDFSYAPTNGIEVTFSSNYISHNRIFECDHGIWGGYSYQSTIAGNQFRDNRIGIAIEHGQHNLLDNNLFSGDKTAIRIWSNKLEPSDWGYPKFRDTRSAAYIISRNSFNNNPLVFSLSRTDSLWIHDNTFNGDPAHLFKMDSTIIHLDSLYDPFPAGSPVQPVVFSTHNNRAFEKSGQFRGRKNIMITEWGPYDFRYPYIRQLNPGSKSDTLIFQLFGPAGKWALDSLTGGDFPYADGGFLKPRKSLYDPTDLPDTIMVIKDTYPVNDSITGDRTQLALEFRGETFRDAFGKVWPAGKPYKTGFLQFFQPVKWEVLFYALDTAFHNPIRTNALFSPVERKAPVKAEKTDRLDYAWWGGLKAGDMQYRHFITVADGMASIAPGNYELSVTWDDAVRVYVDGKMVLDEWNPSRYTFDESPNRKLRLKLGGKHSFRVEHIELGGFACLALKIKPIE